MESQQDILNKILQSLNDIDYNLNRIEKSVKDMEINNESFNNEIKNVSIIESEKSKRLDSVEYALLCLPSEFGRIISKDEVQIANNVDNVVNPGHGEDDGKGGDKNDSESDGDVNSIYFHIESLDSSSLPLLFSDNTRIRKEGNRIIHHGDKRYETCIIGEEMKKVYLLFYYCYYCYIVI